MYLQLQKGEVIFIPGATVVVDVVVVVVVVVVIVLVAVDVFVAEGV